MSLHTVLSQIQSQLIRLLAGPARREDGQGLTEYALILALIAVVAIAALHLLGAKVTSVLSTISASL